MTRFAGSTIDFTPQSLSSAAGGSGYSSAAGAVDVGKGFAELRAKSPKYDEISGLAMQTRSAEKRAAMEAEANVTSAGIGAIGQTKGAALQAEGAIQAAKYQAEAQKQSSMMGAIGSIGSALIGLSDESTKTAIQPIEFALAQLRQLKPVTFYYKPEYGDSRRKHHGFIAQEFRQVLPDATYLNEESGKLCIDTGDVIGLLVSANQELEARVTRLEAKLALQAV